MSILLKFDEQSKKYPTANFANLEVYQYLFGVVSASNFTAIAITPNVGETREDFWSRVGQEVAELITAQHGTTFKAISLTVSDDGSDTEVTGEAELVNDIGGPALKIYFKDGGAIDDSLTWDFNLVDLGAVSDTSYNNEISRNQRNVPPLV